MSPRSTCTAEYLVQSPNPAQPDSMHALHARCSLPMGHRGLHEGDDPFDPTHRQLWDGQGAGRGREPAEPTPATEYAPDASGAPDSHRLTLLGMAAKVITQQMLTIADLRGQVERLELALYAGGSRDLAPTREVRELLIDGFRLAGDGGIDPFYNEQRAMVESWIAATEDPPEVPPVGWTRTEGCRCRWCRQTVAAAQAVSAEREEHRPEAQGEGQFGDGGSITVTGWGTANPTVTSRPGERA